MGVSACKSDNTTYYRAGSIDSGSLFGAQSGCNGCRMTRGSRCARFEVRTVVGREDMYNILLLICYKGGALWNHTTIILYSLLLVSIMMPFDWETIIFNNQPGYEWLGYDY